MIQEVVFDIETQKLFSEVPDNDPAQLKVSIVALYVRNVDEQQKEIEGKIMSFWENELDIMWPYFAQAKRIIGFNSLKFDVPALRPYAPDTFARLPHFDIMRFIRDELGHNLSLDTLARHTLGSHKTDVGTNAVTYWKSHDPESLTKLKKYCESDVILTKELYDFGVNNKFLKYVDKWNTLRNVPVDFSYPKEILESSRQIGLF